MDTITKGDFLTMVKLNHLEVLTQEQLDRNTQILKSYMEKALTSELSEGEKGNADAMIDDVASFQKWCVLRDDFSKAIVYTRREQIAWDEPERGEFGEILKARGGVYKPTAENKKLGRVGQKYGEHEVTDDEVKKFRGQQKGEKGKEGKENIKEAEEKDKFLRSIGNNRMALETAARKLGIEFIGRKANRELKDDIWNRHKDEKKEHDFKAGDIVEDDMINEKHTVVDTPEGGKAKMVYAKRNADKSGDVKVTPVE
jgi:hypothetical protein